MKQEHSLGFKTHDPQLGVHTRNELLVEPVSKQSCINPSILLVSVHHRQVITTEVLEAA